MRDHELPSDQGTPDAKTLSEWQCTSALHYLAGRWPDRYAELMAEILELGILPKR